MNYYIEFNIRARKKEMIPPIMSNLMSEIHQVLVKIKTDRLGVSFPGYGSRLGSVLRVHGSDLELKTFTLSLGELPDGVSMTTVLEIPSETSWACFYRVRPSFQKSKLKNGIKTGHIKDEKSYRIKMCKDVLSEPFFFTFSSSTKQGYKRFVGRKMETSMKKGAFDTFGMSKTSTVPVF